jgi:hypothetical protein
MVNLMRGRHPARSPQKYQKGIGQVSPQDSASVDIKENDLIASPWCVG